MTWFWRKKVEKKDPVEPVPEISSFVQEKHKQLDDLYDAMHETMRAIATFYEKGEAISADIPYDNNFPRGMAQLVSVQQDGIGFMIRSVKESIKPPSEKNDLARRLMAFDIERIAEQLLIMTAMIDQMPEHLEALDAEKAEPLQKYIDEASAGLEKYEQAMLAMVGQGRGV